MNISTWSDEERSAVRLMAADGLTGQEIANALRRTRSSVLGYCHRNGITLPMTDAKKASVLRRLAATPRKPKPEKYSAKFPPGHASHRSRPRGARAFTDDEIATAIAANLAGLSGAKAARMIGASAQSLQKHWFKNPELVAKGRALFETARQDAAERAARRAALEGLAKAVEADRLQRHNAPILESMPPRHRAICLARLSGETLQEIGGAFGVTRERIRQIEMRWRIAGLEIPGAKPLDQLATQHIYVPNGKPRGPVKGDPARGLDGRLKENLRAEVRAARSERMKAMWAERRA